jgi:hypothetical protein
VIEIARFDKYEPFSGGFKALLAAALSTTDVGKIRGVGIDANGRVVLGAGQSGIKGVICPTSAMVAGDAIDVMTDGEIVESTLSDGTTALAQGTSYFVAAATGNVTTTASDTAIGFTAGRADRLIVRVAR